MRQGLATHFKTNNGQSHIARRMSKLLRNAHLDGDERLISYFHWLSPEIVDNLLTDRVDNNGDLSFYNAPLLETLSHIPNEKSEMNRMLCLEQEHFLPDHNLLYGDKMSMAHGVEVRVPFLDNDLVDFASTLPAKFKQKGQCGKWILKKSMENILPHDVIYRPKSGFAAPLRKWIKEDLSEFADDLLSKESLESRGLFNFEAVNHLRKQNQTKHIKILNK